MTNHDKEHECNFVFAVVIPSYGNPFKLRYKVAKRLAKLVKLNFGPGIEVHIGNQNGNAVHWSEEDDIWPKGEA